MDGGVLRLGGLDPYPSTEYRECILVCTEDDRLDTF